MAFSLPHSHISISFLDSLLLFLKSHYSPLSTLFHFQSSYSILIFPFSHFRYIPSSYFIVSVLFDPRFPILPLLSMFLFHFPFFELRYFITPSASFRSHSPAPITLFHSHSPTSITFRWAVILAFDVRVERDAQEMADSLGVKIFVADIIYHLFDNFLKHRAVGG